MFILSSALCGPGEIRTHTPKATDFKSVASANSATSPQSTLKYNTGPHLTCARDSALTVYAQLPQSPPLKINLVEVKRFELLSADYLSLRFIRPLLCHWATLLLEEALRVYFQPTIVSGQVGHPPSGECYSRASYYNPYLWFSGP